MMVLVVAPQAFVLRVAPSRVSSRVSHANRLLCRMGGGPRLGCDRWGWGGIVISVALVIIVFNIARLCEMF